MLDEKQKKRLICHHVRRLGKLGIRVRSLALDSELSEPKKKATRKRKGMKSKQKAAQTNDKSSI